MGLVETTSAAREVFAGLAWDGLCIVQGMLRYYASMTFSSPIAPGAHIELRDAVWRVQQVDTTATGSQVWRCEGISEIVRDQEAVFLQELEPEVRVLDPRETRLERDTSSQHRAGLLYIESLLRDVPPPDDALSIGYRGAMDALEFQLEPAALALAKPRQRILIADAVGLGKTLEAGILLSELIRRGRARRILVVTTKAMLTQFQKELWGRFTIPLVRLDSVGLARVRSEIPSHHNPFYSFDRAIISIDTLKQNNWFRTHVEKAHWDVVVIDEAHNVATRGGRDSQRAGIAAVLARGCDSLILLSATPHDGRAESFASLMNMLDPTAIADPANYIPRDIEGLYVRRFKSDVKEQLKQRVPDPIIYEARSTASAAEELAFDRLTALELPDLDSGAKGGILFRTGLTKALFSSPQACLEQLRSPLRRPRIARALPAEERSTLLRRSMPTRQALVRAAELLGEAPVARELRDLAELAEALEAITPERFSKYQRLLRTLEELGWKARKAREDRLLVFTERRETLAFLAEQLSTDLGLHESQWEILHGQLSDVDQQRIVEDFGKSSSKLRLLLASDVASEGLNLHYLCRRMVHFDMPWSLMVFQQRNGRIDRYGQAHSPQIVYLRTDSANSTIQGDQRVLDVLRQKAEQARENLGDPSVFMGVYDVEEEEQRTAQAMQAGTSAEELSQVLDANLLDPFALVLDDAAGLAARRRAPTTRDPLSLFASDFDYVATGLESLRTPHRDKVGPEVTLHPDTQLIEWVLDGDLKRRYRRLPKEARPDDDVLLLTADPERMQRSLAEARREEDAWPRHQYLWANSPVVQWLNDKVRAYFGRHTAPILMVPELGDARQAAVVVSGLLPNRRGQPLVHRWYVARFQDQRPQGVETFEDVVNTLGLGRQPLPNDGHPVDQEWLESLRAPAIQAVERRVINDRDGFRAEMGPKLTTELERLEELQGRQLDFIDRHFRDRQDPLATHKREGRERKVHDLFQRYEHWIRESMTTAEKPFLQIVAVLVGGG